MDEINSALALLRTGVTPAVLIGVTLWNSDKAISEAGATALYETIEQTANDPSHSKITDVIESFLDRYFSFKAGFWAFAVNVFVLTLVSLLILLSIYTYRVPALFSQLLSKGFLRQFLGDGLVVCFIVNLFALSTYRFVTKSFARSRIATNIAVVVVDLALKSMLFVSWTAFVYVMFAAVGNSFGGDSVKALHAVPITMLKASRFENLTSVYMYSLVLSSFPIFVAMLIKVMAADERAARGVRFLLFWLPFRKKPLRVISTVLAVFVGILAVLASLLIASLQGQ